VTLRLGRQDRYSTVLASTSTSLPYIVRFHELRHLFLAAQQLVKMHYMYSLGCLTCSVCNPCIVTPICSNDSIIALSVKLLLTFTLCSWTRLLMQLTTHARVKSQALASVHRSNALLGALRRPLPLITRCHSHILASLAHTRTQAATAPLLRTGASRSSATPFIIPNTPARTTTPTARPYRRCRSK
jgi:hypothetical protein